MDIKQKIEKWVKDVAGEHNVVLVHPKDIKNGDFAFYNHSPDEANDLGKVLNGNKIPEVDKIETVGNFTNIFLSKDFFAKSVSEINNKGENFGKTNLLEGKKIIIEHTQPNPFKEFHIGHLMNNTIGESICRIIKANGADVKTCSYHGDVGLHVAKAIWAIRKQHLKIEEIASNILGQMYKVGAIAYETDVNAKNEIIQINKNIYDKENTAINELYCAGKNESIRSFERVYKKLDSSFDKHFFESESGEIGREVVKENVGKIFEESEGAVVFRGQNFEPKTHTRVFLNKDGLPTYEAKEIGLAKMKLDVFGNYDQSITVTANEQDSFFNVVEVAIGEIFPNLKGKLMHLSHGMLRLPTGKMSSRTGDVITAETLVDQVKEKVLEKIKDRELGDEVKESIAEVVAIGAIKYSILRQAIGGDIVFDFEKSISFEGDSGPYLQYTAVRAKSVLAKNELRPASQELQRGEDTSYEVRISEDWEVTEVERLVYRFREVVERAAREYAPHHLVTYLTELASSFNSFYANNQIINEEESSAYKVALTSAVSHVLTNGLHILGIKVPESM